jgi:hypothetical protein
LHFVRPKAGAIWVYAVSGLTIANCHIENIEPTVEFGMQAGVTGALSGGIGVYADPHPPSKANPGRPENFSGTPAIFSNDIDMGAHLVPYLWASSYSAPTCPRIMRWTSTFLEITFGTSRNPRSTSVLSADEHMWSGTR